MTHFNLLHFSRSANNNGAVIHTFGVRVVVSRVAQNIITAYPQSATC